MRSRRASSSVIARCISTSASTHGLGVALIVRTLDRLRLCASTLDHDTCHPCRKECDEGDAEHHFDAPDDTAQVGRGHSISVTDRRDGLHAHQIAKPREGKLSGSAIRIPIAPKNASPTNATERP